MISSSPSVPTTQIRRFSNGLTLVGEPMPSKQAAAFTFLIPAGSASEPAGRDGLSSVLESVCYRGAGDKDARALSDALDDLGVDRGGGADVEYTTFGGATLGLYLGEALALYADILLRPALLDGEWQPARDLALQSLESLDDSPARKMFVQLRREYFTSGHGRSPIGTREGLNALSLEDLRADHKKRYKPQGAILSLAGNFDFDQIAAQMETLFESWQGAAPEIEAPKPVETPVFQHIEQDTAQQQIGVAYAGVPSTDVDFYAYRVATSILSGGMGARLFTEVREKRGLVYSVSASASSHRNVGFSLAYAGTTPARAQETLDVLLAELVKIGDGVSESELERAKIGMLSSLIMQEESSRARAGGIARDFWMLGRVRPLDEVTDAIGAVSTAQIREFYARNPVKDFSVVTLGPAKLTMPQ
ncbi:putative Zn-dependent peptidase [Abditibacterium utsteinense]|uniref:Putative Zn-dependent peptidase n=1 Tax=Abditibacterium utsteinense TaxID=1960156 RepID=A0A2S8SXF7_9BACT|nr:pitrilysin family protein [Abditibacterium utsteinense]PQV65485.1 putative Zn-dependent peptidase [Abditibacterium utsteinense]